ncbi:hypothetical protein jhhlp_001976 [Lomentospora prolificans]|uniref:BZIP domain-containing protein n=1 Tax=Lomentospora prolificans TaxID=41688 RepID=A0A2N3NCN6_9PEZI|nr:hypothetical protein jhhlp_001976 [Lomentospora prolificans]
MSIDKKVVAKEDSEESMRSSPENEHATAPANNHVPQEPQQPKRKGGRKPIYATSEERKQRNRQAQAAFRERRTEYIKQLEETIQIHEQNLHNLQTAHRNAADECLMLRYKNSLLERILLEKGIDVQAELCAKTASPNLGPTHVPQTLAQPPPIQRAIMNRHHQSRRSVSSIAPKVEPGVGQLATPPQPPSVLSPKSRHTPPSHANSPTGSAPTFGSQPALSPPASEAGPLRTPATAPQHQLSPVPGPVPISPPTSRPIPTLPPTSTAANTRLANVATVSGAATPNTTPGTVTSPNGAAGYYTTPSFQNHIEQLGGFQSQRRPSRYSHREREHLHGFAVLEQEYDAQADIMDDSEIDTPSGPGPYPAPFSDPSQAMAMTPASPDQPRQMPSGAQAVQTSGSMQAYGNLTQLLEPNLEWDPFGLSASMAFPSQFSFDQSNLR